MTTPKDLLDSLMKKHKNPEDIDSENKLLKSLANRLLKSDER